MKKCEKRRLKLNNAGMTLIELLIAIAIMAVALVPLLYAFVNSAKYNARARELQQTTTLGHTIMENCKAYSLEEIDAQMKTDNGFLEGVLKSQVDPQGTTYYLTDVSLEKQKYDISLEFTPRGINGDSTSSYQIIDSTMMNPYLDAVFTAQGTKCDPGDLTAAECDHNAYLAAFEKISAAIEQKTKTELGDSDKVTLTTSYIENSFKDSSDPNYGSFSIKRESYIHLYDLGGDDRVRVVIRYTFLLNGGKYIYEHVDSEGDPMDYEWSYDASAKENEIEYIFYIYNNYDIHDPVNHPAQVENVYFFYYPAYQGSLSLYPFTSDYIQITNDLADGAGGREINFYLIKQKNPAYPDSSLQTLESNYALTVKGYNTSGIDPDINLYHNFDDNLGGGSTTAIDPAWFTNITTVNSDYVQTDNKILMYDVHLKIYPSGTYNKGSHTLTSGVQPVFTMEGTTLDW